MKNRNDKQIAKLRILNGGRGSGQTVRRIAAIYEEKIADLKANFDYVLEGKDLEIKELKQQVNKMKCCGNCKYSNQESVYSIVCKVGGVDKSDYINIDDNQVCDKWEIKEGVKNESKIDT